MSTLNVAVVQFAPELEPTVNLERMRTLATEAASNGAELIVFPEYSSSFNPKLDDEVLQRAQLVKGPFVLGVQELASQLAVTIVFGLVELTDEPGKFANTVLATSEDKTILAKYQKAHLYDAFGQQESERVVAGSLSYAPVFALGEFTIGLQTCYDLRFPEQTRWLVDAGADLVLIPSEWVAGEHKVHHWKTLLAARAIENTIYIAAADHPGPIGAGHSAILDPRGITLAEQETGEGIRYASVDSELLREVRQQNPSLKNRRFRVSPGVQRANS
jgi:deaminated glutathione amidase